MIVHTALFFLVVKEDWRPELLVNVVLAWTSPIGGILVAFLVFLEIPASVRGFRPGFVATTCHAAIVLAVTFTAEVLSDDATLMVTPLGLEPRLDYVYHQPGFMAAWGLGTVLLTGLVQLWANRGKR